jgi:sulfite reductase (NADPH) hemoprotein beta-component
MYAYNEADRRLIAERVIQFRDQTNRYRAGRIDDDAYRPLRLQNGLYVEKHNPMLRIAIPYGQLSARQLRMLAHIAQVYDRGVGHFTTRHNFQLNWVRIDQVPDILDELSQVDMHAIQSSGSCIRVVTSDALAGVAANEIADPRPWAEIFRQWSTLHPEFAALPRKFKVAFTGVPEDDASVRTHDLGFELVRDAAGDLGFRVWVGGGLGRTPFIGKVLREFLPWPHLLTYAEAVLRVYNLEGRRDNPYKSRIKILVDALGIERFAAFVEEEWAQLRDGAQTLTLEEVERVVAHFAAPDYDHLPRLDASFEFSRRFDKGFAAWVRTNTHAHREPGYLAATLSLKAPGRAPGDATADQLEFVADLAERFGFGEVRSTQTQNLVLPDVRKRDLYNLWQEAKKAGLATPNVGLLTDIVACPGADYCSLANAGSLSLAAAIQRHFDDADVVAGIGELRLNISGCVNACGHHHIGAIGILGVDKAGVERYQIVLGGASGAAASLGEVIGPSLPAAEIPEVVVRLVRFYRTSRRPKERFIDTVRRIGMKPFASAVYGREISNIENEREVANG